MNLKQLKNAEDFHDWQLKHSQGVDKYCQRAISIMAFPLEYPCVMIWDIHKESDFDSDSHRPYMVIDVLHYKYVYIGHFPTKRLKHGTYVYQVFQTSDGGANI